MSAALAIICRHCGSPLDFREGDRNMECPACGLCQAIRGDAGVARFVVDERVTETEARMLARKFLAADGIDRKVSSSLRYSGARLYFLPFWRLKGLATGWRYVEKENLVREETVDEDNGAKCSNIVQGPPIVEVESVSSLVDYNAPAASMAGFGIKGIAMAASVLKLSGVDYPEMSRRGTVVDTINSEEQVRKEAVAMASGVRGGSKALRSLTRVKLSSERMSLVYYPVWRMEFSLGRRVYPIVMDAVNGSVLKARFPGSVTMRLFQPLAAIAFTVYAFSLHKLAGVAALALLYWWINSSMGELSVAALARFFVGWLEQGKDVEHG